MAVIICDHEIWIVIVLLIHDLLKFLTANIILVNTVFEFM